LDAQRNVFIVLEIRPFPVNLLLHLRHALQHQPSPPSPRPRPQLTAYDGRYPPPPRITRGKSDMLGWGQHLVEKTLCQSNPILPRRRYHEVWQRSAQTPNP
jgi:hypothetical protein